MYKYRKCQEEVWFRQAATSKTHSLKVVCSFMWSYVFDYFPATCQEIGLHIVPCYTSVFGFNKCVNK